MSTIPTGGARFERSSDDSLLIYFADSDKHGSPQNKISIQANENVRKLLRLLQSQPIADVRNLHPAYCSLLVKFDALQCRHEDLEEQLREYLERINEVHLPEARLLEIPVCYGGALGPDLDEVAELHEITPKRVIELHTSTDYLVYFLGFVPGFAYLGELPETLVTPRLATPRRKVPPGSVGIAGNQTGVYPCETPGGWRLLGRTPLAMIQPDRENLSLLSIGDRVRFKAISREQFDAQQAGPQQVDQEKSA
jgi:inhibitor of KinA